MLFLLMALLLTTFEIQNTIVYCGKYLTEYMRLSQINWGFQ